MMDVKQAVRSRKNIINLKTGLMKLRAYFKTEYMYNSIYFLFLNYLLIYSKQLGSVQDRPYIFATFPLLQAHNFAVL